MFDDKRLWHRRLADFESFDAITFKVIPRYKTSGLSGDEWRQHVEVEFHFKGRVVASAGFRDMQTALMLAPGEFVKNQEPIPDGVIEAEKDLCDQPSCCELATVFVKPKKLTSTGGDYLEMADQYLGFYRQFCRKHATRGDCSREDCDDNYEVLPGRPER